MPSIKPDHAANRLLAALPATDQQRFCACCEPVDLFSGQTLAEAGEPLRHVYFPSESFASLVAPVNGHSALEVGLVGNEGMIGVSAVLGIDVSPLHVLVQGKGAARRIDVGAFQRQLKACPALHLVLQRYLYVQLAQLARQATCARFHLLEARLARWLLMAQDRSHAKGFHVTQELLAAMLGVRRVGVTKAAIALQGSKLISYRRGDIIILDRDRLQLHACPCYAADKAVYARMLD